MEHFRLSEKDCFGGERCDYTIALLMLSVWHIIQDNARVLIDSMTIFELIGCFITIRKGCL